MLTSSLHPKIPSTKSDVHPLLTERWSARSFSEKEITTETIDALFEAASWAPSSMNEQPWKYQYAHKGTPAFEKIWSLLLTGNQPWCKNASVLIVSISRLKFASNGQLNRHALYDTGAANQNLLLQATHFGIYGHLLGGYQHDTAMQELGISEDETIACMIALGYLDEAEKLPEPFKTRELTPRSRKETTLFVQKL